MNHLIFSAVLIACLGIGGHQYNHQHGPFNKPPGKYIYKEPAQLNSSKQYSWPTLVLPHSTQSVAIYTCVYYVLTYFAGNFGQYNLHAKVFRWMMTVYPIVTALTGFQVAKLASNASRYLPGLEFSCATEITATSPKNSGEQEHVGPICQLWTFISSSSYLTGENLSHLLHLLDKFTGKSSSLLFTGETLVCSLTCNNVKFALSTEAPISHLYEDSQVPAPVESMALPPITSMPPTPEVPPRCTSWLVLGVLLMGLNMYLPQLSPVGSFWSLVWAVIPVLH
ncbi:hypothetical protein DSO57_1027972 [Entomophthora muscae]|uniref:Uncharacterized protein n=1 Tax=Entomophthora muscae TaxID=34485 RepID=A0ACC2ULZ5_9FUNG|nr:hypothetical protein DSO57_1027972 [Entomophthora muscae]